MKTPAHSSIRPAALDDVPEIALISKQARARAMPWLPVLHTLDGDISFFSRRVLPNETVEVVEAENRIAGFIAYADGWINHLYLHPDFWRIGLGSRLLHRAQNQSDNLQLWVFERNLAAQYFYMKHGFVEETRTDGSGNEENCPDVRLRWVSVPS